MKKLILILLLIPLFAFGQIPATTPTKFQPLDPDLTAIAALNGTNTIYYRSAASIWTPVTIGGNMTFSGGTLNSVGGVSDGDKGDITVSNSGATWTIDNATITLAKMASMATASLIYRKTAGSGAPEVNSLATLKTDLGLLGAGNLSIASGKTLTASNTLTLSGTDGASLAIGGGGTLGTAAFVNTGTTSGTIPLLGTGGHLANATMPLGAQLYDNASLLSVDAGNRVLKDSHGTTVIDWETDTLITINEAIHSYGIDIDIWPGPPGPGEDAGIELHSDERSLFRNALQVGVGANTIFLDPTTGYITLGAYDSSIVSSATATRTWTLPNASGTFLLTNGSAASLTSFPTLNQNTAGSAASLSISGQTGLLTFTGLTSTGRIKTIRDAADTILELGGSYTPTGTWTNMTMVTPALGTPASGVVTNLTGTASININGTVGATTPATGAFTTLSNTGAVTNSKSGAASTSALTLSGVPFAGTGTTSFPLLYINDANATASTTLSTAGTYFGINIDGSQDGINVLKDGTSIFKVTSAGNVVLTSGFTNTGFIGGGLSVGNGASAAAGDQINLYNGGNNIISLNSGGLKQKSSSLICWGNTTTSPNGDDTGLARNAAGVVEIHNGTAGTFRDLKLRHLIGGSTAPTIANGAGAGTSPGTPTIIGTDAAGQITIITGTLPSISAVAVTITFNAAYGTAPYVVIWPANASAATLGFLPYVGSTTTTFTVNTGTIALGASTTYLYNYIVVQ